MDWTLSNQYSYNASKLNIWKLKHLFSDFVWFNFEHKPSSQLLLLFLIKRFVLIEILCWIWCRRHVERICFFYFIQTHSYRKYRLEIQSNLNHTMVFLVKYLGICYKSSRHRFHGMECMYVVKGPLELRSQKMPEIPTEWLSYVPSPRRRLSYYMYSNISQLE